MNCCLMRSDKDAAKIVYAIPKLHFLRNKTPPHYGCRAAVPKPITTIMKYITTHILLIAVLMLIPTRCAIAEEHDSSWTRNLQWIPIVAFSPETNLALGGAANYTYRFDASLPTDRTSYVQPSLVYTLNNQIQFDVSGEVITPGEGYYADFAFSFWRFNEYYYGIGKNSADATGDMFDYTTVMAAARLSKQLAPNFFAGMQFDYYGMFNVKPQSDTGLIARNSVTGARGGNNIGIGFSLMYDKRNHLITPTSDYFIELSNFMYSPLIGSDFTFHAMFLDIRKYFALDDDRNVLAFQFLGQNILGNPSFKRMAEFGGQMIHRGFYTGRHRDLTMYGIQAELRQTIWDRLGATLFVATGNVSPRLSAATVRALETSYGFGIRWLMNREEKVNLRLDIGFPHDSWSPGIYLTLGEAF
ncbi:MAG: BamA/TamA family outer membrane protein [Candidatus Kapabacteria bacterium]|nr:BamA/TamA family outer membrane protein [Candidatus Kapabacteria bacterium]